MVKSPDDLVTVEASIRYYAAIVEVLGNQSEKIKSLTGREEIRRRVLRYGQ